MAIAPGGLIKQTIVKDTVCPQHWDVEKIMVANISLINASAFKSITGIQAPRTPVCTATYAKYGLPFFELYKEPSGIQGDFKAIQSVAQLDIEKNLNAETRWWERYLEFPSIAISKKRSSLIPWPSWKRMRSASGAHISCKTVEPKKSLRWSGGVDSSYCHTSV